MLVLLSSSARRRYTDDIVRALAHPAGTEVRFRYGEKYLEPDLAARYQRERAANLPGIICHLASPAGQAVLLIPCRFVTVSRIQKVGSSYVFTLRVGEFVKDLDDLKLRDLMTPDEVALLPLAKSDAKSPPGRFVFEISDALVPFRALPSEAMTAFEDTTEALRRDAKFEAGQSIAFFSVLSLSPAMDGPALEPEGGRYELESGRRYFLDVYSYSPEGEGNPSDAMTLVASADDSDLKFSSETVAKLDSRYDLIRFAFSIEQRLFELPAGLRLALSVPHKADGKDMEQRCDIMLDLRFRGSLRLAFARVAMIAIGSATPAIIGAYAAGKGSLGLATVMFIAALFAGVATVFPALKKA
ncbi:MAG: hypothetical protein AB1542_18345 [Pseudomonadota bacterium]